MARKPVYSITVDGNTIDSVLAPILISISIKSDDESSADELTLEIDDTEGQVELPRMGADVTAAIGYEDDDLPVEEQGTVVSFQGTVDEAHSGGKGKSGAQAGGHHGGKHGGGAEHGGPVHASGSRSKGRTLTITAKSIDMTSKVKGRRSAHKDNATFGDVAREWGQKAGLSDVKVDASLASIKRRYWAMSNESFPAWGARIAHELGATFKVFNTVGVFVSRKGGSSASGQALTPVDAIWSTDPASPGNLIEWSASPVLSRPDHASFKTRWYDPKAAAHQTETSDGGSSGEATHFHHYKHATQDAAKGQCDSNKDECEREKGGCDGITIDGAPDAQVGAPCNVSGIRDGVDGTYLITSVTHSLSRHSGFLTKLGLKQPTSGAGTDSRATKKAT